MTKKAKESLGQTSIPFYKLYSFATWVDYLMMIITFVTAAGAGAALPAMSIVFGSMVTVMDQFKPGESDPDEFLLEISKNAVYFAYLGLSVFFCTWIFMVCSLNISERMSHRMRESYLRAIIHMDIAKFDDLGAGEITTRISNDTNLYQDGVGEKVAEIIKDSSTFISGIVIAFVTEWRLALAVSCIVPIIIINTLIINRLAVKYTTRALEEYSKAGTLAEEAISSIRTAVAFNQQHKLSLLYNSYMKRAEEQTSKRLIRVGACVSIIFFSLYCGYSIAFYFGGYLVNWGLIEPGKVVNVIFAILIGSFTISDILPNLQSVTNARGAAFKLFEAIEYQPKINSKSEDGTKLPKVKGRISFKNVDFHYPSRQDVSIFTDFSLEIKAGSKVALVGASGSGKSTIIQLLERFYDPVKGMVTLDDNDISKFNLKWYRQQLGLVSQEPTLFSGTIADNVALGLIGTAQELHPREQQMSTIMDACRQANAHDFITELPLGYDTQVGERGFLLSGGQKQRIAIARAIIKDPLILLLDEATSALDTKSEVIVQEALDRASVGRTTIVIAHRLSTVKNADVIVVMDKGKVIESGKHEELMKKAEGAYRNLVNLQDVHSNSDELTDNDEMIVLPHCKLQSEVEKLSRKHSIVSKHSTISNIEEGINSDFTTPLYKLIGNIIKLNRPETHWILLGTLGATMLGLIYPVFAIIFASLMDAYTKKGEALIEASSFWALMFFTLAICGGVGQLTSQWGFGMSSEKLSTTLRTSNFKAIINQEIGWFDRENNSTASLVTSLSQNAQNIQGLSGAAFGSILNIVINLITCIIVGLVYGWKLALVVIACLPIIFYAGFLRLSMIRKLQMKNKKAYGQSAEMACENAAAMRTVASLTKEDEVIKHYTKAISMPLKAGYRSSFFSSIVFAISLSTNLFINGLVFWYGGGLLVKQEYNQGRFFTVFMALLVGASGAAHVFAFAPDMNKARDAAASLFYITHRVPQIDSSESGPGHKVIARDEKSALQGNIKFENVHFCYPTRPGAKVLQGVDFEVKPGQFVALVGPSGCGKSTSIGLIERFYDVSKGRVLIDGVDVREYHLPSYRDNIALVGQEPSLYNLSIKENILFGSRSFGKEPSQQQIEEAAKSANIHDFIMSLPQGYETSVGGKGSQLSGGQKQRIAIARALIRNPTILLLDEATSALDAESEKIVQAALDIASSGRTTLAIAHRLASIQRADMILVFSAGYIVERGTHNELLTLRGTYYDMVQQQILDQST